jgi:hypothetical protein
MKKLLLLSVVYVLLAGCETMKENWAKAGEVCREYPDQCAEEIERNRQAGLIYRDQRE